MILSRLPGLRKDCDLVLYSLDNISKNSACSGELSGASAVEHCLVDTVAVYQNSVEHVIYASHDVLMGDKGRHYNGQDTAVGELSYTCYQLDSAAQNISSSYICQVYLGDTLCVDAFRINVLAENQRGNNADLTAGIMSFNISCRILFSVAKLLSELESLIVFETE